MEDLLKTIEQFLAFSDEKLEELSEKNQALKFQENQKERGNNGRKLLLLDIFCCQLYLAVIYSY